MPFAPAPHDIANLFAAWISEGFPRHIERPLIEALRPHRGTWLVTGDFVLSLCKLSDYRDDVIKWHKRPMGLEPDRSVTDGSETRPTPATAAADA